MAYITRASGYADFNSNASTLTGFIPQLFEGKFVEKLYAETLATTLGTTKYSGQIKGKGDSVVIPTKPTIAISDYTIGQDATLQAPSSEAVILTITEAKSFFATVDDIDEYQSIVDMQEAYASDGAKQMAAKIDQDLFEYLTDTANMAAQNQGNTAGEAGNFNLGSTTTPLTITENNAYQTILAANAILDEQNVPREKRWIVVPPIASYYLKQSDLAKVYVTGDEKSPMRTPDKSVGFVDSMQVYVSTLIPYDSTNNYYLCPFGDEQSFAIAMTMTKAAMQPMEKRFATIVKGLMVGGWAVLDENRLGRLVITAS